MLDVALFSSRFSALFIVALFVGSTVVRLINKIKPLTSVEDVAVCVGIVVCRVPFCMLGATLFFSRLSVLFIVALFVGSTVVELAT